MRDALKLEVGAYSALTEIKRKDEKAGKIGNRIAYVSFRLALCMRNTKCYRLASCGSGMCCFQECAINVQSYLQLTRECMHAWQNHLISHTAKFLDFCIVAVGQTVSLFAFITLLLMNLHVTKGYRECNVCQFRTLCYISPPSKPEPPYTLIQRKITIARVHAVEESNSRPENLRSKVLPVEQRVPARNHL